MNYLLYNPLANNFHACDDIHKVLELHNDITYEQMDITKLDILNFLKNIATEDTITILGGDGTLSAFAAIYQECKIDNPIYLFHGGSGNDFLNDIAKGKIEIQINKYLQNIPYVIINDKEYRYINNVGYGIDGAVCEEADILKAKGKKKINYTLIALKLLLGKYKTRKAKITVDGETRNYNYVWLAASMNGKFYGGGMMVAPGQDRLSNTLSLVVMFCKNRLTALINFPKIFKGKLVEKTKFVNVFKGKEIEVEFDTPCALQIDGETFLNVSKYKAYIK